MGDLLSLILSVVLYAVQAIGLQTIANRRGIRFGWLAWVPLVSLWVLGAIADDFMQKARGKRCKMRGILPGLVAVMLVLSVVMLAMSFTTFIQPLEGVVSIEEMVDAYYGMAQTDSVSHMYESVDNNAMEQLVAKLEAALTDDVVDEMYRSLPLFLLVSFGMLAVSVAGLVVELVCWYRVFASCDPANKWVFLVLSALFGAQAVFVFACRRKDLGMVPPGNALPESDTPAW